MLVGKYKNSNNRIRYIYNTDKVEFHKDTFYCFEGSSKW